MAKGGKSRKEKSGKKRREAGAVRWKGRKEENRDRGMVEERQWKKKREQEKAF